jgi:hypothetical protein
MLTVALLLWSSSSRAPTCICDWESRSSEPIAFEILYQESANKVFGKRLHVTARFFLVDAAAAAVDPAGSTLSTPLLPPTSCINMSD